MTRASRRGLLRRATLTRNTLPVTLAVYSGGLLPLASEWTGAHVFVTDDVGGAVEAFSDGVNWRRTTDRAVIMPVVQGSMYAAGTSSAEAEGRSGPYMRAAGVALGTLSTSNKVGAALSAAGAATATLQTPPFIPGALSSAGAATAVLAGNAA